DAREGLRDCTAQPLAAAEPEGACTHGVDDRVAPDVVERTVSADEARGLSDHDAELDFPVELIRAARPQDRLVRIEDRVRPLREDRRLLRDRLIGFLGLAPVVAPDADEP